MTYDAVAPRPLCGIEGCIGKLDQVALELGVFVIDSDPNTDSEMLDGMG